MVQTTTAIYENGVLRPLVSLDLPEHTEIEITFENPGTMRDKVRKALGSLIVEYKYDAEPVSEERRKELAEMFSGASEYIREDRDSRDESI